MTPLSTPGHADAHLKRISPPYTWPARLARLVRRAPPRIDAVLGIACTGHGASLGLVTRDGIVRSSVLDRWSGIKHVLMLARAEDYSIRGGRTEIDRQIKWVLCSG